MDAAYISAVAALSGSLVGSATSLATTVLSQHAQRRLDRTAREIAKREELYGRFIDETVKLLVAAMRTENDDPELVLNVAAIVNRMRLFASDEVLNAADKVVREVLKLNFQPSRTLKDFDETTAAEYMRPLHEFGNACRSELNRL